MLLFRKLFFFNSSGILIVKGEGMNPTILHPALVELTRLFDVVVVTRLGEGKLNSNL